MNGANSPKGRLFDAHCHLHEYDVKEAEEFDMIIVAVSDDYESSLRTLRMAEEIDGVVPCVGVHPWTLTKVGTDAVGKVVELIVRQEVKCVGEVGLDKKFVPFSFNAQRKVFEEFVELAHKRDLALNVHAAGAWRDVVEVLKRFNVRALIHWYTGPLDLLDEVKEMGLFVGINGAVRVQEKHLVVVRRAPLDIVLPESDGPYKYRGLDLSPPVVRDVVEVIAKEKNLDVEYVLDSLWSNLRRLLRT